MSTGYFTHPDCLAHDMGAGHPESPARLKAIDRELQAQGLDVLVRRCDAPWARMADLVLAHDAAYVSTLDDLLHQLESSGDSRALDPDTLACPGTRSAAWRAAGAAVAATEAVIDGQLDNAFCAIRPPGHHATRRQAMGFCLFNNVAIAARHALDVRGLKRVAVVDFDVHHGNGTQDILDGDDRVLMVGFYQHPFYPHSGGGSGSANMANVPVAAHSDGRVIREVVNSHWLHRLERFRPEMIFISAGFDAHRDDPLGDLRLVEDDYAWITTQLMDIAKRHAQGRIVSCLEGGYNLEALGRSVAAHARVLIGG